MSETDDELDNLDLGFVWKSKPECWSDDPRMASLFKTFRSRELNPLHYDNKLKFWKETILSFCKENTILRLDVNLLENCFKRKSIKPKCLDLVLKEMHNEGTIKSLDEALKPKSGLMKNIFNKIVWSPLAWSTTYVLNQTPLSFLVQSVKKQPDLAVSSSLNQSYRSPISSPNSSFINEENSSLSPFININLLESKSIDLLNLLNENVVYQNIDHVLSYDELKKQAHKIHVNQEADLDLIINYLEVNKKFICFIESKLNNKRFIKFTSNLNQNVVPVTEIELSYANLKESERLIEDETTKFENEIESINNQIRSFLKLNNKQQALKYLKKRKIIENKVKSKESIIYNIQTLMTNFQQADNNKMTFDIYTQSASALKEANKAVDLDKLDDTVADLQDIMCANSEIEDILKSPISTKYKFDDQELNDELNELLEAEKLETTKNLKLKELDAKLIATTSKEQDLSFNMNDLLDSLPKVPQQNKKIKSFTTN